MKASLSLAVVLAASLAATPAFADPAAQDRATARAMFDEGRRLAHAGNFVDACPKFQESQRIDPGIGTLFNLADCYEHTGRTASAWSNYLEVADAAMQAKQAERERIARARAARLVPRLSHLVFTLADKTDSVSIRLDSTVLGAGAVGAALPVDPGAHAVLVSAAGKKNWATTVTIPEGATHTVDVPALESEVVTAPPLPSPPVIAAAPAPPPLAPNPQTPRLLESHSEPKRPFQRPVALGLSGLGVVGLAAGTFFGLRAQSQWSTAEPQCPGAVCTPSGHRDWSDSRRNATASTVAFASGGALLAAGVVLWLTAPKSGSVLKAGFALDRITLRLEL